ncbi:hypothetical protein B0H14DRAFT_3540519 [Mycena olivaceomarginata]|nr:hypothetical protein B0H14DRAFT_3540519 [Mycena olivaceomarginata]
MQNSTDDEASDSRPSKRLVPRTTSTIPVSLPATSRSFPPRRSGKASPPAKLALSPSSSVASAHSRYKPGSDQEHQLLLEQALPRVPLNADYGASGEITTTQTL